METIQRVIIGNASGGIMYDETQVQNVMFGNLTTIKLKNGHVIKTNQPVTVEYKETK